MPDGPGLNGIAPEKNLSFRTLTKRENSEAELQWISLGLNGSVVYLAKYHPQSPKFTEYLGRIRFSTLIGYVVE